MTFAETPINEAGFRRQAAVLCRRILLILSAAITVVFLAGSVFIVTNALETRNAILRSITAQALTISNAFDREVTAAQYLLRGLSQSPALWSCPRFTGHSGGCGLICDELAGRAHLQP